MALRGATAQFDAAQQNIALKRGESLYAQDKATQDPREQHAKPPFREQKQSTPGHEAQMAPGRSREQSYRGSKKLLDKTALITGGDSGIGRAVALAFARGGGSGHLLFK